jgi:hypothetical protein
MPVMEGKGVSGVVDGLNTVRLLFLLKYRR